MKTTLQLILIGLLIMCFSSCYTQKKAEGQVNRANDKYPEVVGKLARDLYPCTDLLRPDTVLVTTGDTIVIIECPDAGNDYTAKVDTVRLPGSTRTVRVPVTLPVQVRTITNWYEDSAKLKLGALELTRSQAQIQKLTTDLAAMSGKRDWYRRYFFMEGGILLLLLILAIWRLWKRATTIKTRSV